VKFDSHTIPMSVQLSDIRANKIVSNSDVASVKSQVAAPVTTSNFRNDVNANGVNQQRRCEQYKSPGGNAAAVSYNLVH
jgi:hypothetical protein